MAAGRGAGHHGPRTYRGDSFYSDVDCLEEALVEALVMKVIIDYDGVKREFDGPFHILLDSQSFWSLWRAMKKRRRDLKKRGQLSHYGWLDVPLHAKMTTNTTPSPWT